MQCNFEVGETPLIAMKSLPPSLSGYSADGTVFLEDTGLEILLSEASGAFGTRDRRRNTYDHIKGAYGCFAMLHAILTKYPYGDKDLVNNLCVLFLHASGKGKLLYHLLHSRLLNMHDFFIRWQYQTLDDETLPSWISIDL